MERRKFIIGVGALGAGTSAALSTGAFTNVEAERSFEIGTAGDDEAYIRMQAVTGSPNAEYVDDSSGTLSVTIDKLNEDAKTAFADLFEVSNHGSQPVGLYIGDDETDVVSFEVDGESVEGAENAVSLDVGDSAVVDLVVDTREGELSDYDNVSIHADSDLSGTSQSDSNTVFVSQSDSSADYTSIQEAVDALADRSESTVLVAGETFEEDVEVATGGVSIRSEAGATIDGGFDLTAHDVTISGFTFTSTTSLYGSGNTAVYVRGTSGHNIIGNSFESPTIEDEQTKGVLLQTNSDIVDVTLSNNSFTGYTQGVYLNATNEATFTNNTFSENEVGIAGVDPDSVATITDNVFDANTTEAIGVLDGDAEVHRNDFLASNAATVNNYGSTTIDAQNNWWGTTDAADVPATFSEDGPVNYKPIAEQPFNPGTVIVEEEDDLRDKLASARPGDTVEVTGGTFDVTSGPLEVPSGVTFEATDDVTLQKSGQGVGGGDGVIELTGPGTVKGFNIQITPDGTASRGVKVQEDVLGVNEAAEIIGNTISREGDSGNAGLEALPQADGGAVAILDNDLSNTGSIAAAIETGQQIVIKDNTVSGSMGEGIYTWPHAADAGDLTIEDNTVTGAEAENDIKLTEVPSKVNGNSTSTAEAAATAVLAGNSDISSVLVNDGDGESSTKTE